MLRVSRDKLSIIYNFNFHLTDATSVPADQPEQSRKSLQSRLDALKSKVYSVLHLLTASQNWQTMTCTGDIGGDLEARLKGAKSIAVLESACVHPVAFLAMNTLYVDVCVGDPNRKMNPNFGTFEYGFE